MINPIDWKAIKLVVSDMDGTLLNDNNMVSDYFYKLFEILKQHNIHFVAASGRQFQSITDKLKPIVDDISIIGENGAIMKFNNNIKVLLELHASEVQECVQLLRQIRGCHIVLCGQKSAYVDSKNSTFITLLKQYYSVVKEVEDLCLVQEDAFLKIAVYHFQSTETYVDPQLNSLRQKFQITVSGQHWLDISHRHANKAFALKLIQKEMQISAKQTLVFGDYNNDLQMLELGAYSFAMANAHPNVKAISRFQTGSNSDGGVEQILEQLVASLS